MNEKEAHTIKKGTVALPQGLVRHSGFTDKAIIGNPKSQTRPTRGSFFSDLTIPILPRFEVFDGGDENRWDMLGTLTKNALDTLTGKASALTEGRPEMRFFGQLQRLHMEIPDALVKEVCTQEGNDGILVMKPVFEAHHIWAIPMAPIFSLRIRSPKLFASLLSFVHSLPFDNVFKRMGYLLECLLEWSFEVSESESDPKTDCCAEEPCVLCFIEAHASDYAEYEDFDWLACMRGYRPKNTLFKMIRDLLLEAPIIDFNAFANLCFLEDDMDMEVDDLIVFLDREDSQLENGYINFVNEIAQYGYSHTIYDTSLTLGNDIKPFVMREEGQVNAVFNFMDLLNELLKKL